MIFNLLLAPTALLISTLAVAQTAPGSVEKTIAETISKSFSMPVDKVTKSAQGELYEVLSQQGLSYTDKSGSFLMFNAVMIDTMTKENLTEKRMNALSAFNFKELPLKDALRTVVGNGARKIVTVEDPNCGYCKKLHTELHKLKDVTIYTFVVPMLGPDSIVKSRQIMCSKNPVQSWNNYMSNGITPEMESECETPLERNSILAKKLYVRATPTILFENGDRIPGSVSAEKIEEKLVSLQTTNTKVNK